jgi:hypothetical protein
MSPERVKVHESRFILTGRLCNGQRENLTK